MRTKKYKTGYLAWLLLAICLNSTSAIAQLSEAEEESLAKNSETEINVKDADIAAIVRIFSKKTKRNYILDERVKGKVSIYLPGKVSSTEAINILDSVLALKGFTTVPIGDNLWKIIAARDARQTTIPTIDGIEGRGSAAVVTRLISLKHVGADEVKTLITPLVSANGLLNAYTGTNSLILIDSEDNIKTLMEIIESLDIPFTDQEMLIVPVKHAEATDIADKITQILGEGKAGGQEGGEATTTTQLTRASIRNNLQNPENQLAASDSAGRAVTVSARLREPKIIADERTNSIIVVADEATGNRVRALVSQLDSPVDLSGNRFYVYRCQHANAEEIAEVLSGLVGGGGGGTTGAANTGLGADGTNTNSRNRGNQAQSTQDRLSNQRRTPGRSRSENQDGGSGISSVNFGENISVTADPATNSLVINAGKSDYEKIKSLLKQLDVKRRQVLVEALILEVGVDDRLSYSTEFSASGGGKDGGIFGSNTQGGLSKLLADPSKMNDFTLAAASAGVLNLPGDITIPSQQVLLSAASKNTNVNVLSSPNILATDNEQAEIVVGQNVPFLSSTSSNSTNLNNTFNQVDRQDVGITLRITPQISSSDFVTLNLFTEVSNVVDSTASSSLGPTTTIRTSETTVITKNDQMVVIGGLMSDDISDTKTGVPFLKDIPLIGSLFDSRAENQRKTNLLIFITPRIIKDQFDARDVTLLHRNTLENEIDNNEIEPDRKQHLHDKHLNKVIEVAEYEGKMPGTQSVLKPYLPRNLVDQNNNVIGKNSADNSGVIELKVTPKLPTPPARGK